MIVSQALMQMLPFVVDREEAGPIPGCHSLATKGQTITGSGNTHSHVPTWSLELVEIGIKMKGMSLHQIIFFK